METLPDRITDAELEVAYRRALDGETVVALAREAGRVPSTYYRMLRRRYGFVPRARWSQTLRLPDDPTVIGYVAGILDGEGCIRKSTDRHPHWSVFVGMTDRPVVEWLAGFGGRFQEDRRPDGRKLCLSWRVDRAADVMALLAVTLPYLIVKRDIAVTALRALEEKHARADIV